MKKTDEPQVDVEGMLNDLDRRLSRLRVTYEQYFIGVEKRPPDIQLKQLVRLLRELESMSLRNTAHKFRLRSLTQKFQSYRSYWNRSMREIEAGTYKRHKKKLEKKKAKRDAYKKEIEKKAGAIELDIDMADFDSLDDFDMSEFDTFGEEPSPSPSPATYPAASAPQPGSYSPQVAPQPSAYPSHASHPAPTSPPQVRGMSGDEVQRRANKLAELKSQLGISQQQGPAYQPQVSHGANQRHPQPGHNPRHPQPSANPRHPQPGHNPRHPQPGHNPRHPQPGQAAAPNPRHPQGSPSQIQERPAYPQQGRQPTSAPSGAFSTTNRPSRGGYSTTASGGYTALRRPPQPRSRRPATPLADEGVRRAINGAGLSERRLRSIYDELVTAKRECNQPTGNLSYDSVVRSIAKQAPAYQQKHRSNAVDFQVVIKDGNAYLKPKKK